jgi:soluble lytic murein transglycosylase-like protein
VSYVDAVARVNQLHELMNGVVPTPAPAVATASATDFTRALATTSASPTPRQISASAARPSSLPTTGEGAVPAELAPLIESAAQRAGVDPALVAAIARAESGFRADAGSPAGAQGLMQLMPSTAAGLGVTNLKDPEQSLNGGARYLRQMLDQFGGDTEKALAAYNAGPGAVTRYGGVPPYSETAAYVPKVMEYYAQYRGQSAVI